MSIQLSPATKRGMFSTLLEQKRAEEESKDPHIETVMRYVCPHELCGELHEYRDDAIECCAEEPGDIRCPVCNVYCANEMIAADCCLWKDLDAPARWTIADKVNKGATWAEAIAAATGAGD